MNEFAHVLFFLVFAHCLADYPLQGEFLATAKDRNSSLGKLFWRHALFAHSMIHAGGVALVTGSIALGLCEAIIHGFTDWLKCEKRISLAVDQAIHFACKIVWAAVAVWWQV